MAARTTSDGLRISTSMVAAFAALLLAFVLGGASGYVVRAVTRPIPAATQQLATNRSMGPCPPGSHVVVSYIGQTWACISDVSRVGGPGGQVGDAP